MTGIRGFPQLVVLALACLFLQPGAPYAIVAQDTTSTETPADPRNAPIATTSTETPADPRSAPIVTTPTAAANPQGPADPRDAPIPGSATPPTTSAVDSGQGWIAYTGTDGNIWVVRPDGSDPRFVTVDGSPDRPYVDPSWSHDGSMLVFATQYGSAASGNDIYLLRDGVVSRIPTISNCGSAAFAPDDSHLLLLCGIDRSAMPDPEQAQLDESPAHGFVSAVEFDGSSWRVVAPFLLQIDGAGTLWWNMLYTSEIDVSPVDGEILVNTVFMSSARSRQIHLIGADGTWHEFIDSPPNDYGRIWSEFAADGENLLTRICRGCYNGSTEQSNSAILLLDRAGNLVQTLYTPDPNAVIGSFTQSPDGARLLLSTTMAETDLDFGTPGLPYTTQMVDIATGAVTDLAFEGSDFAWQPVASELVLPATGTALQPVRIDTDIEVMALTCVSEPEVLAVEPHPAPPPAGCTRAATIDYEVFTADGESLGACITPDLSGSCTLPASVGIPLTIVQGEAGLPAGYAPLGGETRTITIPDHAPQPPVLFVNIPVPDATTGQDALTLTPGADRIAYVGIDGNIWLMDKNGANPIQVTDDALPDFPYGAPAWSNDGAMLAFVGPAVHGDDATPRVYLLRDGVVAEVPGIHGCGVVAFMPGDQHLALGCGLDTDMDARQSVLNTDPSAGFVSVANLDGSDWRVQVPFNTFADGQWPVAGDTWSSSIAVAPDGTILLGWYTPDGTALAVVPPGGSTATPIRSPLGGGTLEGVFVNDGNDILALMCPGCYKHSREDPQMVIALLDRQGTITETLITPEPLARLGLPSLSSGGSGLLVTLRGSGYPFYGDIQLHDLASGSVTTLADGMSPVWQPGPPDLEAEEPRVDIPSVTMFDVPIYAVTCESDPQWREVIALGLDLPDDCRLAGDVTVSIVGADGTDFGTCVTTWSETEPCRLSLPIELELSITQDPETIPDGYEPLQNPVAEELPPDTTRNLVIRLPNVRISEAQTGTGIPPADGAAAAVPTSGQLAFSAKHGEHWDIYLHDFGAQATTQLTADPGSDQWAPAWSHDGSQLAYLSDSSGSNQVWLIAPDGSNQRQLTDWEGDPINAVAWGSDDQTLFLTLQGDTAKRVVSMPVGGGDVTDAIFPSSAHPAIARDGSMVFVRDGETTPMLIWSWESLAIDDQPSQGFTSGSAPAVDPSGNVVVYQMGEHGSRRIAAQLRDGAFTVTLPFTGHDDSNPVLTADAMYVLWVTADGTAYSLMAAPLQDNNGQFARIDVGQHDQIWYLAWRP